MIKIPGFIAERFTERVKVTEGLQCDPDYFHGLNIDVSQSGFSVDKIFNDLPEDDTADCILVIPLVGDRICLWPITSEMDHVGNSIFPSGELAPRLETAIDLLL